MRYNIRFDEQCVIYESLIKERKEGDKVEGRKRGGGEEDKVSLKERIKGSEGHYIGVKLLRYIE